jgi:hypothetical protein
MMAKYNDTFFLTATAMESSQIDPIPPLQFNRNPLEPEGFSAYIRVFLTKTDLNNK